MGTVGLFHSVAEKLTGNSSNDFGEGTSQVVQALAAKEDLKAGTVIDDPDRYFTSVNVPALPDRGYSALPVVFTISTSSSGRSAPRAARRSSATIDAADAVSM